MVHYTQYTESNTGHQPPRINLTQYAVRIGMDTSKNVNVNYKKNKK